MMRIFTFERLCLLQDKGAIATALAADEQCPAPLRELLQGLFGDAEVDVDRERVGVSSCAGCARRRLSAILPLLPSSARRGNKSEESLLLLVERMVNIFTRVEKAKLTAHANEEKEEEIDDDDDDDYAVSSLSKRQLAEFVDLSILWVVQDAMNHLALLRELDSLHPRELAEIAQAIEAFDLELTGRVEEADVPALLQRLARVAGTEPYTPEEVVVALFELAEEAEGEGQEGIFLAACAHWWVRE